MLGRNKALRATKFPDIVERVKNCEYTLVESGCPSEVWAHFQKIVDNETGEILSHVMCRYCDGVFSFRKGFSISNLRKHGCYKRICSASDTTLESEEEHTTKKPKVVTVNDREVREKVVRNHVKCENQEETKIEKQNGIGNNDQIQKEVLRNCIKFVTRDLLAVSTVNEKGFKNLSKSLVAIGANLGTIQFTIADSIPNAISVRDRIHKLHATELKSLVTILRPLLEKGLCAGTTEIWRNSKQHQRGFLTLTVHFLLNDWKLHNRVFFTVEMNNFVANDSLYKKSAEIMKILQLKFESLQLSGLHKMITFTTEEASNIEHIECNSRVNCMVHVINNMLEHTFDKTILKKRAPHILELISKCESLVENLKCSGITKQLAVAAKQQYSTKWNTTYDMCFSVRHHFNRIREHLEQSSELDLFLAIDKYLLDKVLNILRLFKHATQSLESERVPTIHLVLLTMHLLRENLEKLKNTEFSDEVRSVISHCLENVFGVTFKPHRTHKIAAFLWPEFKQLRYMSESERKEVWQLVKDELLTFAETNDNNKNNSIGDAINNSFDLCDAIDTIYGIDDLLQINEQYNTYKDVHAEVDTSHETRITIEMELYKGCKYQDSNVLRWWQVREKEFPLLSKLARYTLCVPASNAASPRSFNSTMDIFREKRKHLQRNDVDAMLFLHSMYKYQDLL